MAIFIPPLVWAGAAGVAVAGFIGKKVYDGNKGFRITYTR